MNPSSRSARIVAWACAALALLGPANALAQVTTTPGTPAAVLPNVQQLTPPPPRPEADAARLPTPAAPPARELARPADELRLDVAGYQVDGGPPALAAALAGLTERYVGKDRSYEDLQEAAAAVTRYLQATLGHYLGYAYIPEQRLRNGIVQIAVLEGRLDRVVLEWPAGMAIDRAVVEAHLAKLIPGSVLLISEVERVVFLLNDLRGLSARFEFREGRDWGTAELRVKASPEPAWLQRIDVDTDGSRFSGVNRIGGQWLRSSPLGRGDALTLSAQVSTTGGLGFVLLGYTTPVGADGLKLGASASAFKYRFDKTLLPQEVRGYASAATVYALYPLRRSRNLNLFGLVSLDYKRFVDQQSPGNKLEEARKHTEELRLGLNGDFRDDALTGGVNTYELSANLGQVVFESAAPAASDDARQFRKLGYGFTRLQNLVTNQLLLYLNLRGQQALSNLDSTQQFRLGGADSVRAFASGELPGDSGQLLTAELRWLPPEAWFGPLARQFVASLFYDLGHVKFRTNTSQRPVDYVNSASLGGAGLGLVWERPGNFNARLFAAWPTMGRATGDQLERRPRLSALFSKTL